MGVTDMYHFDQLEWQVSIGLDGWDFLKSGLFEQGRENFPLSFLDTFCHCLYALYPRWT